MEEKLDEMTDIDIHEKFLLHSLNITNYFNIQ